MDGGFFSLFWDRRLDELHHTLSVFPAGGVLVKSKDEKLYTGLSGNQGTDTSVGLKFFYFFFLRRTNGHFNASCLAR